MPIASWVKLPFRFDSERLRTDLNQILPQEWAAHFNQSYYEGQWSGVALRSVAGKVSELYSDPVAREPYVDTPILGRCPYFQEVLSIFQCRLKSVRLLKLSPGSQIREHSDPDLSFDGGEMRVHIPLQTNPDVEFILSGNRLILGEGECWYLDFSQPHRVWNRGATDRIHLVIDGVVNDWVRSVFAAAEDTGAGTRLAATRTVAAPHEGLEQFRKLVLENSALQKVLREAPDEQTFLSMTLRLSAERGCRFTREDIVSALSSSRRTWSEQFLR